MLRVADANEYEDVFVFKDLVYAMERNLRIVHVYKYRNKSLIQVRDIRYPCKCNNKFFLHSIIVTKEHIIQCCVREKLVSLLDHSAQLLRKIPIADTLEQWPILRQVDVDGNILIDDRYSQHIIIAHVDQPSSRWCVVKFPERVGSCGAVWFRHKLYVADNYEYGRLLTFTPTDE